jgi:hypothetical protein
MRTGDVGWGLVSDSMKSEDVLELQTRTDVKLCRRKESLGRTLARDTHSNIFTELRVDGNILCRGI